MIDQVIYLHPLTFMPDGGDVVVGRPATDSYAVLPSDGAEVLHRLAEGMTPAAAAEWYEHEYGEPLDILDYLETLNDLGFISEEGPAGPDTTMEGVGLQRLGRSVFSPLAFLLYLALCGTAVALMIRHPHFAPRPSHVFFTKTLLAVELVAMFAQIPLLLAHEGFHALAARRLGLPSRLGVSHRLYFIVFETRLSGILSVPRRQRYLCYLAGMLLDLALISTLTMLGYSLRSAEGGVGMIGRLALALTFPIVIRLGYQFVFFLQTDVYYVFATALGCHDLHGASRAVLHDWWWRLLRRPHRRPDLDSWTPRDLAVARPYAPLRVVGAVVLVSIWVFGLAPVLVQMVRRVADSLSAGVGGRDFLDSFAVLLLTVTQLVVLVFLGRRDRRNRQHRDQAASTSSNGELS